MITHATYTLRRAVTLAVAAAMVALTVVAIAAPADAVVPGENGRIAFASDRSGDSDIWLMDPNGRNPDNLSQREGWNDLFPAWSPDGTQLAWQAGDDEAGEPNWEVFTMAADGSGQRNLTRSDAYDGHPEWSPDGTTIAYVSDRAGPPNLWLMDANGSNARHHAVQAGEAVAPTWSPDGTQIAFCSDEAGSWDLWVVRRNGSGLRQLSTAADSVECYPSWSPDASTIAFHSNRGGQWSVWLMDADGSNERRLGLGELPSWSPDGEHLLFTQEVSGKAEVWVMDPDGGRRRNLTKHPANDEMPAWQSVPPTPAVGLVDPMTGQWHLRDAAGIVKTFYFGNPGDYPMMGDWDCDGVETPGLYRQSDGYVYLSNANRSKVADIRFFFGDPGDVPLAGDFDADGCDTVSIYRPNEGRVYIINELGSGERGLGQAEFAYYFGNPGDKPFVGDFDGDGIETIGLHRESTGLVYFSNEHRSKVADRQFIFGDPGDRMICGDWNEDGNESPALFRPSDRTFYFRYTNTQGAADVQFTWGEPDWLPISGEFSD